MDDYRQEDIRAFTQQSEVLIVQMQDLIETLQAGALPSEDTVDELFARYTDYMNAYEKVYVDTGKILLPEDRLLHGSTVSELNAAVESALQDHRTQQIAEIRQELKRFLDVRSDVELYAQALMPYQEKMRQILQQDRPEDEPETEAARRFLQAIQMETIHTPEGLALVQELKASFPEEAIQFGLIGQQFYLGEPTQLDIGPGPGPTEKAQAPSKQDADKEVGTDDDRVYPVCNKVKKGNPSATSFRKDLAKMSMSYPLVIMILPLFTHYGLMTLSHIQSYCACLNHKFSGTDIWEVGHEWLEKIRQTVEALANKGYLACFEVEDEAACYCLSTYCAKCLRKGSIASMEGIWLYPFGTLDLMAETELSAKTVHMFLHANDSLSKFFYAVETLIGLDKWGYDEVIRDAVWKEDHYQVSVVTEEGELVSAYMATRDTDILSLEEPNILINVDLYGVPPQWNDACQTVYAIYQDYIVICDPDLGVQKQLDEWEAMVEGGTVYDEIWEDEEDEDSLFGEDDEEDDAILFGDDDLDEDEDEDD